MSDETREAVARIIDPAAFQPPYQSGFPNEDSLRRKLQSDAASKALAKADTILRLIALARASVPEGWEPIASAPTMEAVLVFGGEVKYPVVASWTGLRDEPWCLDALGNVHDEIDWPTHWMPLPAPPADAKVLK